MIYDAWKRGCVFDAWSEHFRYDLWLEAGGIEPIGKDEMEMLKQKSGPMITNYMIHTSQSLIELDAILDMLEIRLITISPMRT